MSNVSLSLDNFLQYVPVCEETANLETVLAIFQSGNYEKIVVVSERQVPLGIINCRLVMLYLWQKERVKVTEPPDCESRELHFRSLDRIETLIEPIEVVSAQTSVREFFFNLRSKNESTENDLNVAVVNSEGKFLGLLDNWKILKFSVNKDIEESEISNNIFPSAPPTPNISLLQSLQQFLERLPLPFLLQSADGKICKSNSAWYERLDNFSLPKPESLPNAALDKQKYFDRAIGDRYWWFVRVLLDPQVPIWLTMAVDITQQHKISQKLAAKNADLVQLNQLKAELLSSFSHELKSPITAVVGLASLLQEQKLGKLNQRQVRYVKQIYDSGRQLMLLANNILDLMRIEAGQMQLQFKSINIEALCQSAYIEARSSIYVREKEQSKTETKFTLTIEQNLETMVGDELRLRQMLVHLLTNALQATAAGGEIGLKASRWDEWISFMVWDTGVGIPPEIQPLIFQKMQPLQRDLSGPKANGLGLLLTQRLARNHGGDISFSSQVGRGSQFTLFIPANPHRDRHQKKSNRLVLIVESVDRHIASLTEKLLQLGYYFAIARSGTEALLKAEILQPAIILLDPALPQLSGWEVLTLLKSNPNTKNIPTLVTAESNQKQRALQNGAIGFLSLPVQLELLKESLDRFQEERLVRKDSLKILHLCERTKNQTLAGIDRKENFALTLNKYATSHNHRILEADSLEQADIIARVWKLDVLLLDRKELSEPLPYLRSLCQYESLASLPLVTLNSRTTKAANKIGNLSVFPCLIPIKEQNLDKLFQVIEIAASMNPSIE